jgi:hypothetical protein
MRHPDKAPELLKYVSIIREAAQKFPGYGWREYDKQFRMRQAYSPSKSWASIDGELWYLVLLPSAAPRGASFPGGFRDRFRQEGGNNGQRGNWNARMVGVLGQRSWGGGMPGQNRGIVGPKGVCWAFNREGCSSPGCTFAHICARCRQSGHAAKTCGSGGSFQRGGHRQ